MSTLRTPKRLFDCFLYTRGPCTKKPLQFTIIYAETPSIVACSFLFEAETLASWSQIFGDNGFRKKWWAKRGTQKKIRQWFSNVLECFRISSPDWTRKLCAKQHASRTAKSSWSHCPACRSLGPCCTAQNFPCLEAMIICIVPSAWRILICW